MGINIETKHKLKNYSLYRLPHNRKIINNNPRTITKNNESNFYNPLQRLNTNGLIDLQYFKQINSGSCKVVYALNEKLYADRGALKTYNDNANFVVYAPKDFTQKNENELTNEFETMRTIQQRFVKLTGDAPKNLALEAFERRETNGHSVLVAARADGSLEDYLNGNNQTLQQSISYIKQMARGVSEAHLTGFVLGDIKPDNFLLYSDGKLRVSDFGKSRDIEKINLGVYKGNPYYMPPEGLGEQGDVFSVALCIIRIFESILNVKDSVNPVVRITKESRKYLNLDGEYSKNGKPLFNGITKYLIQHPNTPHCPDGGILSVPMRISTRWLMNSEDINNVESAVHLYIDALAQKLLHQKILRTKQVNSLKILLKDMTKGESQDRPKLNYKIEATLYEDELHLNFKEDGVLNRLNSIFPEDNE